MKEGPVAPSPSPKMMVKSEAYRGTGQQPGSDAERPLIKRLLAKFGIRFFQEDRGNNPTNFHPGETPAQPVTNMTIPAEINTLSKLQAAEFYHGSLGWAVHPLYPPSRGGKRPVMENWTNWTADQVEPVLIDESWAKNICNIGVVVRPPFVVVDLDSKKDSGASVQRWLSKNCSLDSVPRERTAGGVHLHFQVPDLPTFKNSYGKVHRQALQAKLNSDVNAELFFDGTTVVISPSVHEKGCTYTWEQTGQIPTWNWDHLKQVFGFQEPEKRRAGRPPKQPQWWTAYKGDAHTLDIIALCQELGIYGEESNSEKGSHSIRCPWGHEHSGKAWNPSDHSTVIFVPENGNGYPGFKCLHTSHGHNDKTIGDFLAWAESCQPGVVDRHCKEEREYKTGHIAGDGRVKIELPGVPLLTDFCRELSSSMGQKLRLFVKNGEVTKIEASKDQPPEFRIISPAQFCSEIEEDVIPGYVKKMPAGEVFIPASLDEKTAKLVLAASQFTTAMPRVERALPLAFPIRRGGQLDFTRLGYDSELLIVRPNN
jgi:hypothetical protein